MNDLNRQCKDCALHVASNMACQHADALRSTRYLLLCLHCQCTISHAPSAMSRTPSAMLPAAAYCYVTLPLPSAFVVVAYFAHPRIACTLPTCCCKCYLRTLHHCHAHLRHCSKIGADSNHEDADTYCSRFICCNPAYSMNM